MDHNALKLFPNHTQSANAVLQEHTSIKKHSIVISGHRTSISLENIFWNNLRAIAVKRGLSVNQLVSEIDQNRNGNLSSAIRTYILWYYINTTQPEASL